MARVLVFCESAGAALRPASLSAVAAARELAAQQSCDVVALLIGADVSTAATELARFVPRVLTVTAPGLGAAMAETWAPVLAAAARDEGATAVLGTSTATGKDLLPRAAALLEAAMASDIVAVLGPATFRRPSHAGNALTDVQLTSPVLVASVRQTAFPAAAPAATAGTISARPPGAIASPGATVLGVETTRSSRPDLVEARTVVSGGRGMKTADNFHPLEELADLLGGALGASRAAVDAGMVPNDLQVGQTGKIVAPELYVAVAISGAIQHLAGMKGSKVIVAINKDPDAPIFQVADYGLVESWENALPALIDAVRRLKAAQK